ncbi:MAG: serine kinase, partial [Pseudolabrys sp.]
IEACGGRLVARTAEALASMLEIRGLGIRRLSCEPIAVVGLVIDLAAADAERYPAAETQTASIHGIMLPRLAVAPGQPPLDMVLAYLGTSPAANLTLAGHLR